MEIQGDERPKSAGTVFTKATKKEVMKNLTHKFTIGKLLIWLYLEESKHGVTSIRFDPGNKYLAAGLWDSSIEIYNLFTGELSYRLNKTEEHEMFSTFLEVKYPVTSIRWRPQRGLYKTQSILVNACADGTIKFWHTTSGKLIHTYYEEKNGVYCIDYNNDGTRLVSGGTDTKVRVYDDATKDVIHVFDKENKDWLPHFNRVFSVKFDPYDDRLIYSGGWDGMININDTREKGPVSHIVGTYISADTLDVHNTDLLVGNYNSKDPIEIYDLRKLEKIKSIEWKTEESKEGGKVLGAMYSKPDAEMIIAWGSLNNELKIFDSKTDEVLASLTGIKKPIFSIDAASASNMIAFGSSDGRISVLEYNN